MIIHKKRKTGRKKSGKSKRSTLTPAQLAAKKRKIAALREMTVERGCPPPEAANARERVKELEAQIAHAEAEARVATAAAVKEAARPRGSKHRVIAAPLDPNSCAARVAGEYANEMSNLREAWEGYQSGDEDKQEAWYNYGLSFDYVAPGTFTGQRRGYFRYQISWGGPSDEFRFYVRREDYPVRGQYGGVEYRTRVSVESIEYWFMDWFDGAKVDVTGRDFKLLADVFEWFKDSGSIEAVYDKAMADADED